MSGLIDPEYATNQLDDLVDFYCSTTILVKDVKNPAEINQFCEKKLRFSLKVGLRLMNFEHHQYQYKSPK